MHKHILILALSLIVSGCSVLTVFQPEEYVLFEIRDESILPIDNNSAYLVSLTDQHSKIWTVFTTLFPPQWYEAHLKEFRIYSGVYSSDTGFVEPINETTWSMGMNLADTLDEEGMYVNLSDTVFTMVHEFSHILTLNKGQVDQSVWDVDCVTFFTGEGCAFANSYIYFFKKQFWTDEMVLDSYDRENNEKKVEAFYLQHSDEYVSSYAATNLGEDIAESFTYFVLYDKPDSDTVANKKILFFYSYPELVELREDIRDGIESIQKNEDQELYYE